MAVLKSVTLSADKTITGAFSSDDGVWVNVPQYDVGTTFTVSITPSSADVSYQWSCRDIDSSSWNPLDGQTSNTFTATYSLVDTVLRCIVTDNNWGVQKSPEYVYISNN